MHDAHAFKPLAVELEERPVSPLGRGLFWLLLVLLTSLIAFLYWGQVDVVVTARGSFRPVGDIKIVQPLEQGVVQAILVKEGQVVQQGQALIQLQPELSAPEEQASEASLQMETEKQNRLDALLTGRGYSGPQQSLFLAQRSAQEASLQALDEQLLQVAERRQGLLERQASLLKQADRLQAQHEELVPVQDLLPKQDMDALEEKQLLNQQDLSDTQASLAELRAQMAQIHQQQAEQRQMFRRELLSELHSSEERQAQLTAQLEQQAFRSEQSVLTAPVSGTVQQLQVKTVGSVLTPAEEVLRIIPANTPLEAVIQVTNQDLGVIKTQQAVHLKVESYEFQRYGMLEGTVEQIAKNSMLNEQRQSVFEVLVQPEAQQLKGQPLQAGMSVTAELVCGQRRLIDLLLAPITKATDEAFKPR